MINTVKGWGEVKEKEDGEGDLYGVKKRGAYRRVGEEEGERWRKKEGLALKAKWRKVCRTWRGGEHSPLQAAPVHTGPQYNQPPQSPGSALCHPRTTPPPPCQSSVIQCLQDRASPQQFPTSCCLGGFWSSWKHLAWTYRIGETASLCPWGVYPAPFQLQKLITCAVLGKMSYLCLPQFLDL